MPGWTLRQARATIGRLASLKVRQAGPREEDAVKQWAALHRQNEPEPVGAPVMENSEDLGLEYRTHENPPRAAAAAGNEHDAAWEAWLTSRLDVRLKLEIDTLC